MKIKTRIFCFITVLLMIIPLIFSCAEKKEDADNPVSGDTSETSAAEETASEMEKRKAIPDNLPNIKFDGMAFRVATRMGALEEVWTEEENGEILNDELYLRNRTVEERFNTEIKAVITNADDGNTHVEYVKKTIRASDDAFDLAATYVFTSGPIITEGLYLNWLNMEYNDFTKPWWINGINSKFQVGNALYAVVGDMCITALKLTYGIFYNKRIGENNSIGDIYQEIRDGNWTIERFISIVRDVYSDANGDSLRDSGDVYGFTAETATNLDVYTFAFDIPIIGRDDNNVPEIVFKTEKAIKAVEIVNDLYWGGTGSYIPADANEPIKVFKNGNAMFTTTWLGNAFSTFRDMEDDYSILPYPKYDDNQEIYMTGAMDNYSVLGVPITAQNLEMISIITEAINAQSHKTVFPVYYEQALQNKFARDTESIEMVDIIMKGRNFDFVTLFSANISGMPWLFRGLVAGKSNNFASKYDSSIKSAQSGLDQVIKAYEKNAA